MPHEDLAKMHKRRLLGLTLSLLTGTAVASSCILAGINGGGIQAVGAATTQTSATGLDERCLRLANRGEWSQLIEKLQSLTDEASKPTNNHAWLAFGLMFQERCEDLKSLSQKVQRLSDSQTTGNVPKVVEVFNLICQKKLEDADKLSGTITTDDVITDMAKAALSAKSGNAGQAIDYCRKAVALAPDFAWGYRTIGFIYERTLKNNTAAEESYVQALNIQPDCKEVRDLLVDQHIGRHDYDGAIDLAVQGIRHNPQEPVNYYRLSQIYTQQWRLREAAQQLDKAIRLAPDNARFHRAKASILRYQRKLNEAIAEQKRAVDLSTDKPFELTELAALNELAGNDSAAADSLKQAIALAPASQAAHQAALQKLVQLLIKGQRWDDLIAELNHAIQSQPKQASLRLGLADALVKAGKTDEAMSELKSAAEIDNNDPRPHRLMGALLLQKHDFPAAARAYTRALNINPGSVEDLVALGYTYAANDDYMQAETAFVTALALQQLTQAPGSREEVMRSLAILLLTEGRYTEATLNYEEVLRSLKNTITVPQDSFMLAQAKALRDRTNAAAQNAVQAFDSLPDSGKDIHRAGLIDTLLRLGKVDSALEQLSKVPDKSKDQCQWLILESRAYRLKGDLTAAEQAAQKAIAAKDDSKELQSAAYTELSRVLLAEGDLNGADTAVRKATDLNTKSFTAYEVMGRIYLKRGDTEHALEAAKHSTDINPYHTPSYMLIGDAYTASNKLDQAATNYKRAIELYPTFVDAHRSLRDVYKKLADKDQAEKEDRLITQIEKNG